MHLGNVLHHARGRFLRDWRFQIGFYVTSFIFFHRTYMTGLRDHKMIVIKAVICSVGSMFFSPSPAHFCPTGFCSSALRRARIMDKH